MVLIFIPLIISDFENVVYDTVSSTEEGPLPIFETTELLGVLLLMTYKLFI